MYIGMLPILFLLLAAILSAAPHRFREHPNAALTITSMAEDPRGMLWLAATDGLFRFDGLHYQRFPGAPFRSVRFVGTTQDGSMWIAGQSGLARYRGGKWEVASTEDVSSFAVASDMVFFGVNRRVHRIDMHGRTTRMPQEARGDLLVANGALWLIDDRYACGTPLDRVESPDPCPLRTQVSDYYVQAAADSRGVTWCADRRQATPCSDSTPGELMDRHANPTVWRTGPLLAGRNGQLWFLGETVRGIFPTVEFRPPPQDRQFLPTAGLEDSRGHLWTALRGKGLVEWIPDAGWARWDAADFDFEPVSQVFRFDAGTLAATHGDLFRLDRSTGGWTALRSTPRHYYHIANLDEGSLLASVRRLGLARLTTDGKLIETFTHPRGSPDRFRKIVTVRSGTALVGGRLGLFLLEKVGSRYHLRTVDLPESGRDLRAVDLEVLKENRLWVGYSGGIGFFDVDWRWHPQVVNRPLEWVNSISVAEDTIWLSYRDPGSFSRLDLRGLTWDVKDFLSTEGYGPPETSFIKRSRRIGWVWRGTRDGVYVTDRQDPKPEDWLHLSTANGLSVANTEPYGFLEDGDAIWIAGIEGVTRVEPSGSWFAAPQGPAPWITRMQADGKEFFGPDALPESLPASTKSLVIEIGSLETPSFRDQPFRYRLTPGMADWTFSNDGTLRFQNLRAGAHRLEVAYTGDGPSKLLTYSIQVAPATRWWIWPSAVSLSGILILALRRFPGLEGLRYGASKAVFVAWRRLRPAGEREHAQPNLAGRVVGERYLVTSRLSSGGFSLVYEGRDEESGKRVAIKVLNAPPGNRSWIRQRFAFEVAALQSIEHPGVVPILDWWAEPGGAPAIAMPFVEGPTLRELLKMGPIAPPRAARIVRQLGSALAAVHARGVVHRDLKPENVILSVDGDGKEIPVIVDFETAGLQGAAGSLTMTSMLAGSPEYMAPERTTGHYSPATDVYSLGVLVLELLTARRLSTFEAHGPGHALFLEMAEALKGAVDAGKARQLAAVLMPAVDSDPKRRPTALADWTALVSELICSQ
jgi:hypothetical protein